MAIVTIGGIPVYDALILDGESGMMKISLVDDPAVMSNFQAFDSQKKMMMYEVTDEERRLVRGVVMRADFPIYRRDSQMGEYYIIYKADTIRQMAEKYLVENRQNDVNTMHFEDSDVEGVNMVQCFIKGDGISVDGFDECADGSLFAEFHVVNDEVWDEIKKGTYRGFSLEGIFDLAPEQDKDDIQEIVDSLDGKFNKTNSKSIMSKLSRIKAALVKALAAFGNITTDKGILAWDGDDDLKAGDSVFIEDADGERTPAEDGNYKTDDNKTIVVVDGRVSEILDPEAEVAPSAKVDGASVDTDKGTLIYEGETLEVGSAVYMVNPDDPEGDAVPAEDGEYKTEDGKVIKVVDGKVESIKDEEETPSEDVEMKAKRQTLFSRIKAAFSDSYEDKTKKIYDAIIAAGYTISSWITEAGDDYAILEYYDDQSWDIKHLRFDVSWDTEGNAIVSNPTEVKEAFVPVEETAPAADPAPSEEEFNRLKAENETLKKEVEKLKKTPAAKPAHEEVRTSSQVQSTGVKNLDTLARYASAK